MKLLSKKYVLSLVAAISFCTTNAVAAANIYNNVTIDQIASGPAYGGDVVLSFSGMSNSGGTRPACSTEPTWHLRFDATTDAGKQVHALALLAWSTGAPLAASGQGYCVPGTSSESLRWLRGK